MSNLRLSISLLYVPAGVGIVFRMVSAGALPQQLLALALFLFCLELAHMAEVDLKNVLAVAAETGLNSWTEDSRLLSFRNLVCSTIVLELLGFYGVLLSLQWGGIIIIFSQLWFNLLVKIQLWPQEIPAVTDFELSGRLPVLIANTTGLALLVFWFVQGIQLFLAIGLLVLVSLFLVIKYAVPAFYPEAE